MQWHGITQNQTRRTKRTGSQQCGCSTETFTRHPYWPACGMLQQCLLHQECSIAIALQTHRPCGVAKTWGIDCPYFCIDTAQPVGRIECCHLSAASAAEKTQYE